jgi:hypothetical protein
VGFGLHGAVCGFDGAGCGGCTIVLLRQDAEEVDEGLGVASDGGVDLGSRPVRASVVEWFMMGWFPLFAKSIFLFLFRSI